MFDLAAFSSVSFWAFLQVFVRVSTLFVSAPVFGSREIPAQVKVGLATILSLVLLPLVKTTLSVTVPPTVYGMVVILLGQALVGLMIGLVVSLIFVAVRVGGELIDYQMGFTQAATFNPQFNETVSPIGNFQYQYALVLYLIANGHWMLLAALERSFVSLPVAQISISGLSHTFTDLPNSRQRFADRGSRRGGADGDGHRVCFSEQSDAVDAGLLCRDAFESFSGLRRRDRRDSAADFGGHRHGRRFDPRCGLTAARDAPLIWPMAKKKHIPQRLGVGKRREKKDKSPARRSSARP